ncbi:hypothetical protein [Thalassobaculum sp.]|uniref:HepT-like ribonuclease domain-containing protein n=1 Tax=Thalassobaculum sp. TaxID=2022740 RepID=UPI0032EE2DAA
MNRQDAELVEDILEAINRISDYTKGQSYEAFLENTKTQDAVFRCEPGHRLERHPGEAARPA